MLNRKNHCNKTSLSTAIVVIAAAHIAAGVILCKGMCHHSTLEQMAKKAKRTVVGLVREII